jgi:signal transduction histidine kinase
MARALTNLLDNALLAGGPVDVVRLSVARRGDHVAIGVVDHGEGMTAEAARRALDPFYTTRANGHGLGLAIARQIVEDVGGRIVIESERDVGTSVRIELPVASA